jgi:hypothetical protein
MSPETIKKEINRVLDVYARSKGSNLPSRRACPVRQSALTPGEYVLIQAILHGDDWHHNAFQPTDIPKLHREYKQRYTPYMALMGLLWPECWYGDIYKEGGAIDPWEVSVDAAYRLLQEDYRRRLGVEESARAFATQGELPDHIESALRCLRLI